MLFAVDGNDGSGEVSKSGEFPMPENDKGVNVLVSPEISDVAQLGDSTTLSNSPDVRNFSQLRKTLNATGEKDLATNLDAMLSGKSPDEETVPNGGEEELRSERLGPATGEEIGAREATVGGAVDGVLAMREELEGIRSEIEGIKFNNTYGSPTANTK